MRKAVREFIHKSDGLRKSRLVIRRASTGPAKMRGARLDTARPRQQVVFMNGFWWFVDLDRSEPVRLNPLFSECEWKVGRLSARLGLGSRTFARVLEESLGIGGKAWLRQLRAVEARHLLREGGKICEVALSLGFRDDSHFSREFRAQMGVAPHEYVRSERERS